MPDSPITEETARTIAQLRADAEAFDRGVATAELFAADADDKARKAVAGEAAVLRERADDLRHQGGEVGKLAVFYRDIADYVEGPPGRK